MIQAKHTPGPWVRKGLSQVWIEVQNGWKLIATVGAAFERGTTPDEQEANIKLIAAAPELLETLEEVVRKIDDVCGIQDNPHIYVEQKWRDVIAKAKGGV